MCRCRTCGRHDRHWDPWTVPALAEQVVADLGRPQGGRNGRAPGLTVQDEIGLRRALVARLGQLLEDGVVIACPWRVGAEVLAVLAAGARDGRRDPGGPLLAPYA
ncbi:MAG: hypothetical protein U0237_19230 [Thermoleophilia bacterium]